MFGPQFRLSAAVVLAAALLPLNGSLAAGSSTKGALLAFSVFNGKDHDLRLSRLNHGRWSRPTSLGTEGNDDFAPTLSTDAQGNLWVAWSAHPRQDPAKATLYYSVVRNGVASRPEPIHTGFDSNTGPNLLVDQNGSVWLAFSGNQGDGDEIYVTRFTNGTWQIPTAVSQFDRLPDVQPVLSLDNGQLSVTWSGMQDNQYKTFQARLENGAWSSEKTIAASRQAWARHSASKLPSRPAFLDSLEPASIHVPGARGVQSLSLPFGKVSAKRKLEPQKTTRAATADVVIAGFGDSITDGGYPAVLEDILRGQGLNIDVIDFGKSGETTVQGVGRVGGACSSGAATFILEGNNDAKAGIGVFTTAVNLYTMAGICQSSGSLPFLGTLMPDIKTGTGGVVPVVNGYVELITDFLVIPFADHYSALVGNWGAYTSDGLHPNGAGDLIISNVWINAAISYGL
ncbi:MAG: GDSL-type esterase/lipase family protein [Gammaproteobacteria bacterium]|nr:GDSL-type esterase/lipase family protein [Gammaproteobacteria bacterium]